MAKLTTAEKKELAKVSEIPVRTLEDWCYKKSDEDYREFIYFILNTMGIKKIKDLKEKYNEYINMPEEERPF